jgi:hypothetical protein
MDPREKGTRNKLSCNIFLSLVHAAYLSLFKHGMVFHMLVHIAPFPPGIANCDCTVFFWAPAIKWGLVIAGLADINRPIEKISTPQQTGEADIYSLGGISYVPIGSD